MVVGNHTSKSKISQQDVRLIRKVTDALRAIHENGLLNFECHSICGALSALDDRLRVAHGCYCGIKQYWKNGKLVKWDLKRNDHTWLIMPGGNIIDAHPVAMITNCPVVVIGKGRDAPFGSGLYVQGCIQKRRYRNKKVAERIKALKSFLTKSGFIKK